MTKQAGCPIRRGWSSSPVPIRHRDDHPPRGECSHDPADNNRQPMGPRGTSLLMAFEFPPCTDCNAVLFAVAVGDGAPARVAIRTDPSAGLCVDCPACRAVVSLDDWPLVLLEALLPGRGEAQ